MDIFYRPYFDPEFESLIERINPPRVCIDNDTCQDCTLVKVGKMVSPPNKDSTQECGKQLNKVDSANKHGILLEMVQVLTDLDLVISKSYISSDGEWLMDVFHVTDELGNKITDQSLINYIQQAMCTSRRTKEAQKSLGREVRPHHVSTESTALEMTGTNRPGLMSEISAVLVELGCQVTAAVAWTHNNRAACIIYVEDESKGGPIEDPNRLAHVQEQLKNVVEAHHQIGERKSVKLMAPVAGQTHSERRLHQLMSADRDYEQCCSTSGGGGGNGGSGRRDGTHVNIENCREKGYSVVNIRSRDRPKLLFDTVCTLTDMNYVVFHAAVSSKGPIAIQEYYIRHRDGCTMDSENERRRVGQCLIAAIERRVSHGLRLDVCTKNRVGLLSDVTRVFRENGLSITRAEIGTCGARAVGSFYVTDVSGNDLNPNTVDMVRQEIGGTVVAVNKSSGWPSHTPNTSRRERKDVEDKPRFSLGDLFWSQIERLSSNFGHIKS